MREVLPALQHPLKLLLRYHSQAILASLRRGVALEAWCELRRHTPDESVTGVPAHGSHRLLERALGALDMFVIKDDVGDLDHVCALGGSLLRTSYAR